MTTIKTGKRSLRGSPLAGENPQPLFRQPDIAVAAGPAFPKDKLKSFGAETGFKILPYTRQDRYTRVLEDIELDTAVMENDFLRAELIPALGGRLWSLFDKKAGREILYRNPVFRPANLAIREAWFSGGIEWNIGRLGHAVHTCSPVFAGTVEGGKSAVLRIWEFERQTRLFWRIDFSLSGPVLYAYVRIENPDETEKPLYWWTNTAVPQTEKARVLSASGEVIYFVPGAEKGIKKMDGGTLPRLPVSPDVDASYPASFDYSAEYFFQCEKNFREEDGVRRNYPWEAAVFEDGYAFAEASTPPLFYRKMFCWGQGSGGHRWQEFLTLPESPEYLEVQAGIAPTQLHSGAIDPLGTVDFVQAFTGLFMDRDRVFAEDYSAACAAGEECLAGTIGPAALETALEQSRARAGEEVREYFSHGSGWGALECSARHKSSAGAQKGPGYPPAGLGFPEESIGAAEKPWLALINTGALPSWPVHAAPPGFPGADGGDLWQGLLLLSPGRSDDWLTPWYLGVIDFEQGNTEQAKDRWTQSLGAAENPWALRNLALAELRQGDAGKALDYYRRIFTWFDSAGGSEASTGGSANVFPDCSFIEEFISLLLAEKLFDEAFPVLEKYAERQGIDAVLDGPLVESYARLAFAHRDDALLDRIFSREPPHLREGNNALSDIWISREIQRLSEKDGLSPAEAEQRVRNDLKTGKLTVPRTIDFRMYTGG